MNYLHYEVEAGPRDVVQVSLDSQANVRLLDPSNFQQYRDGKQHRYYGGLAKTSPVKLVPPSQGHWHVVIDLGGYAGTVRASVETIKGNPG